MHTEIRNKSLFCNNCGGKFDIKFPIGISEMTDKIEAFNKLHADCEKTCHEMEANSGFSVNKRALWWIENGQVGASSKTMWSCFMGVSQFHVNYPYDPDDFSRCYKLLRYIPEWKTELHKLKRLCFQWKNLVENWDKLTEMYEQNAKEDWKNADKIGMYEFMKKLIN